MTSLLTANPTVEYTDLSDIKLSSNLNATKVIRRLNCSKISGKIEDIKAKRDTIGWCSIEFSKGPYVGVIPISVI